MDDMSETRTVRDDAKTDEWKRRAAAADELAADALAEVERLRQVLAERDAHGRTRTAQGLRERNRADEAEAALASLQDKVRGLADNYSVRANHAPAPFAKWADIERDLRVALGEVSR